MSGGGKFKTPAIPWFNLNFLVFYYREKEPHSYAMRFLPPRPSPPVALLWIKKGDTEDFKLQRVAIKFSANIIGCWSICLQKVFACERFNLRVLDFKAAQAKEAGEAGKKTSAFEMVSPPRKQVHYR